MDDATRQKRTWLIAARERAGLSQERLAELCGVTDSAVCHWELGRTVPLGASRLLLCLHLGLSRAEVDAGFAKDEVIAEPRVGAA